jgi:hypothetical protein
MCERALSSGGFFQGGLMISDEELFRQWQQGNAEALEALAARYHRLLLAYLYRLVGEVQTAEDLAQETFVSLVPEAQSYHYPRPFAPWLYTIAHNLARNNRTCAYPGTWQAGEASIPVPEHRC